VLDFFRFEWKKSEKRDSVKKVHSWHPSSLLQELDIPSETIVLVDTKDDVAANDLSGHVPGDRGRFVFYLFKHTFEGDFLESVGERELNIFHFFSCFHIKLSSRRYCAELQEGVLFKNL